MKRRWPRAALILLLALSALRFLKIGASLTLDEGYMLQHYSAQPVDYIRSHYEAPNNHILLAIILHEIDALSPHKLIVTLNGIWAMQLVSILSAVGSLWLTYVLGALLFNETIGLFAATAFGVSGYALLYSHMLRGYSLSALLGLLAAWLVYETLERRRYFLAPLIPPALLAFHYVIPVNIVFTGGIGLWALYLVNERRLRALSLAQAEADAQRARLAEKKGAQKLEKAERALQEKRQAALREALRLAGAAAGLLGLALALTYWAYLPVVKQMSNFSATPWTWSDRFSQALRAMGLTAPGRWWFFLGALAGLPLAWRKRSFRGGAVLGASMALLALTASTLQRNVLPARTYVPALPYWAMLFGAAAYPVFLRLRRAIGGRWLRPALCLAIAGSFAPELRAFAQWHRGVDLRGAMERLEPWAAQDDDFSVVFCYPEWDDVALGSLVADQYYGFAANMLPFDQSDRFHAAPYLPRRRYVFIAQTEEQARKGAADSGLDRFQVAHMRLRERVGTLGLYEADADDAVLADYRGAAAGGGPDSGARAEALAGLGADALRRFRPADAQSPLEAAVRLAPRDARARFLLGYARYLSGDGRAASDFEWTIAHDTMNAHVRLYYADLLAQQGRAREAAENYEWYLGPKQLPAAWFLGERARAGLAALQSGRLADPAARGAYEKAELAFELAARLRPLSAGELAQEARLEMGMRHFARAAQLAGQALAAGGGPEIKMQLAGALAARKDFVKARDLVDGLLASYPNNPQLQSYRQFLAGM